MITKRGLQFAALAACAVAVFGLSGCAMEHWASGDRSGPIPESDWNVNLVLLGARGGAAGRSTSWCPLYDYESFGDGIKVRMLGPFLPNLLGYIDMGGEDGVVTPVFSMHSGNIDSVCFGPFFLPLFRYDHNAGRYWRCVMLGVIEFGSYGGGLRFIYVGGNPKPVFAEAYYRETERTAVHVVDSWEW